MLSGEIKKRKEDEVWNSSESTVIEESQADWHMTSTFLRAVTKPEKIQKFYLLFLFLPFIRFFIGIFMLDSLSTFPIPHPYPAKGARDSAKDPQNPVCKYSGLRE